MGIHVAFDIGNVLCQFKIENFVDKLSHLLDLTDHDAWFFLEHLQKMQDIGVTSMAHGLEYKFKPSPVVLNELLAEWNSTLTISDMMLNFLDNLKSDGVKIALLSNMGPEHISHLRLTCPQIFENAIQHISCEVGARKPQKLFFQSFCLDNDEFIKSSGPTHSNGVDFRGCVYVDDIEENLKVGKRYGFKVYNFNLDDTMKLSMGKQKIELDKLKRMIYENC